MVIVDATPDHVSCLFQLKSVENIIVRYFPVLRTNVEIVLAINVGLIYLTRGWLKWNEKTMDNKLKCSQVVILSDCFYCTAISSHPAFIFARIIFLDIYFIWKHSTHSPLTHARWLRCWSFAASPLYLKYSGCCFAPESPLHLRVYCTVFYFIFFLLYWHCALIHTFYLHLINYCLSRLVLITKLKKNKQVKKPEWKPSGSHITGNTKCLCINDSLSFAGHRPPRCRALPHCKELFLSFSFCPVLMCLPLQLPASLGTACTSARLAASPF